MMNEVLGIVGVLASYSVLATAWRDWSFDAYLNVAQAAVDASRSVMVFDQITNADLDVEEVTGESEFDLPFIDLSLDPNWWFEMWVWDFHARSIIMEHAASRMLIDWPEFDTAEF